MLIISDGHGRCGVRAHKLIWLIWSLLVIGQLGYMNEQAKNFFNATNDDYLIQTHDSIYQVNTWWRARAGDFRSYGDGSADDILQNKTFWKTQIVGARHQNGSLGMIVNPSVNRLLPAFDEKKKHARFKWVAECVICPDRDGKGIGIEGEAGNRVLTKVSHGIASFIESTNQSAHNLPRDQLNDSGRKKILCLIYTAQLPYKDNHMNLRAQAQTWGRRCDGFIGISNLTDHSIGAIDLPHSGTEVYGNMWQKVRTAWFYAYENYLDDFDWFHIGGDDMYVSVDNLRSYIDGPEVKALEKGFIDSVFNVEMRDPRKSKDVLPPPLYNRTELMRPRPLLLGIPMMKGRMPFPAGGPGYTLNRAALKVFGETIFANCMPYAIDSREDVFVGSCFWNEGIYVSDTRDKLNAVRYVGSANTAARFNGKRSVLGLKVLKRRYGIEFSLFENHTSDQAISFHLKDDISVLHELNRTISDLMYRYHTFLYSLTEDLCE